MSKIAPEKTVLNPNECPTSTTAQNEAHAKSWRRETVFHWQRVDRSAEGNVDSGAAPHQRRVCVRLCCRMFSQR